MTDDRFVDILEDEDDNPLAQELRAAISALNVDGQTALVALAWLGRGDYTAEDWPEALRAARERSETTTATYLLGLPLLGDYLADGADALGISVTADEARGLFDPDLDTRGG